MNEFGILSVAFGQKHVDEALQNIESFRKNMSDMQYAVITDSDAPELREAFSRVIVHEFDKPDFHSSYHGFFNKIRAMELTPFERTLFVDTDIFCVEPVYELLAGLKKFDVICVHAPSKVSDFRVFDSLSLKGSRHLPIVPEINTGVIAYNRLLPFEKWKEMFRSRVPNEPKPTFSDQPLFRPLVWDSRFRISVMTVEYNLRVSLPAYIQGKVRLLHGRPKVSLAEIGQFINSSLARRIYIPFIGLLSFDQNDGEWHVKLYPDQPSVTLSGRELRTHLNQLNSGVTKP